MLSHLLSSTLKKLTIDNFVSSNAAEATLPTLEFPSRAESGTGNICGRCRTLLSHIVWKFGDGSECKDFEMPHSWPMSFISAATPNRAGSGDIAPLCVICAKILLLFDGMKRHVSFEDSLRETPSREWNLTWKFEAPGVATWHKFSAEAARVGLNVRHKGGYGWGIGHFMLHPDSKVSLPGVAERRTLNAQGIITALGGDKKSGQSEVDFSSTASAGTRSMMASWVQECKSTHTKCGQVLSGAENGFGQPVAAWFPDRLVRITAEESLGGADVKTRIVLKSDPADFPTDMVDVGVSYLSLSHCWGPAPNPKAPLGGRADTVLTEANLSGWREELPLKKLPLAFQHAVKICAALGFDHIWIDSLCIIQDSVGDWQQQSAVMADVYKFAWLNIAALSTASDLDGFISQDRDPRIIFGFHAPLAPTLGLSEHFTNSEGRSCVLLRGDAKLLWDYQSDLPGGGSWMAPLHTRAWVYQETSLARRMLSFSTHGVFFSCDEGAHGEHGDWPAAGAASSGPRRLQHAKLEMQMALLADVAAGQRPSVEEMRQQMLGLTRNFDSTWKECVSNYTSRQLTKNTDRLIAISAVARELASSNILKSRYLAGLWETNLIFQLAWITVEGRKTPWRVRVGRDGYVAPSWSWASIEGPAQPANIFQLGDGLRALAKVVAADVSLASDFLFGPVTAGWVRLRGCLRSVSAVETKSNYSWSSSSKSTSLTDAVTGERLWFASDTTEGYEIIASRRMWSKVVWMPLTLHIHSSLDCKVLVLIEVLPEEGFGGDGNFVRSGEKVYRRLGTGNFGRISSLFRQDKLLMALGTYPETESPEEMARGFVINDDGYQEFVVI